jgi:hypothetical protein
MNILAEYPTAPPQPVALFAPDAVDVVEGFAS